MRIEVINCDIKTEMILNCIIYCNIYIAYNIYIIINYKKIFLLTL